jgi:hypothetical protein
MGTGRCGAAKTFPPKTIIIIVAYMWRILLTVTIIIKSFLKIIIWRAPGPLTGPALTNDLCGQYVKVKFKIKTAFVLTLTF